MLVYITNNNAYHFKMEEPNKLTALYQHNYKYGDKMDQYLRDAVKWYVKNYLWDFAHNGITYTYYLNYVHYSSCNTSVYKMGHFAVLSINLHIDMTPHFDIMDIIEQPNYLFNTDVVFYYVTDVYDDSNVSFTPSSWPDSADYFNVWNNLLN